MKNLGFFFIFAEQFNRCVSFLLFFGDDVEEDKDLTGCTYFYGYNTIVRRPLERINLCAIGEQFAE